MSRKLTDPVEIPVITATFEKEKWIRLQWTNRYLKGQAVAVLNREPTNYTEADIAKSIVTAEMVNVTRDHILAAEHKLKVPMTDSDWIQMREKKEIIVAMLPVPEKERKLLYTKPREVYLKKRYSTPPDKKYRFIECESWKYGWQFDQSKMTGPSFGRFNPVLHQRSVGPQPDPPHYYPCMEENNLCGEG
ncbi:hypothetical protein B5X24_HaOG215660 [Helicoverpa armigera]|nr:hypothetical protein B5X24_HaOG215660 [Helicoverpa armigera]